MPGRGFLVCPVLSLPSWVTSRRQRQQPKKALQLRSDWLQILGPGKSQPRSTLRSISKMCHSVIWESGWTRWMASMRTLRLPKNSQGRTHWRCFPSGLAFTPGTHQLSLHLSFLVLRQLNHWFVTFCVVHPRSSIGLIWAYLPVQPPPCFNLPRRLPDKMFKVSWHLIICICMFSQYLYI